MIELPALKNLRLPDADNITADSALASMRPCAHLPKAPSGAHKTAALADLLDEFALILTGSGVINVGLQTIPGIDTLLEEAKKRVDVLVLNRVNHPSTDSARKYRGWGFAAYPSRCYFQPRCAVAHLNGMTDISSWTALDSLVTPPEGGGTKNYYAGKFGANAALPC